MSKVDEQLSRRFRDAQREVGLAGVSDQLDHRRMRRLRRRRFGSVALAVVVLAGTIGGVAILQSVFRESDGVIGDAQESGPSPTTSTPSVMDVRVEPGAWHLVIAYGSVWVSEPDGVIRVDMQTGEILARIPVPGADESDITAGARHVWVTTGDSVVGIDVFTDEVDRRLEIQAGIRTVAYAEGHLYVGHSAEGNGTLLEIDPLTEEFGRDIVSGGPGLGESEILPTEDAFWVGYSSLDGAGLPAGLVRVSSDLSRAESVEGIDHVFSIAQAGGYVWATGFGVLYQVTPDGTLVGTFHYPRAGKVASDRDHLWLLLDTGSTSQDIYLPDPNVPTRVVEVDTQTGALIGEGAEVPHYVPANIAAVDGEVWVSFYEEGILTKLTGL